MSNDTPQWIIDAIQDTRRLLGVGDEWHITVRMSGEPAGERSFNGAASYNSSYLNAQLEFARDLKDDDEGRRVIVHEVFHVALAGLFQAFEYAADQLPKKRRRLCKQIYNDAEEKFIQRTTRAMQREIRPYRGDDGHGEHKAPQS